MTDLKHRATTSFQACVGKQETYLPFFFKLTKEMCHSTSTVTGHSDSAPNFLKSTTNSERNHHTTLFLHNPQRTKENIITTWDQQRANQQVNHTDIVSNRNRKSQSFFLGLFLCYRLNNSFHYRRSLSLRVRTAYPEHRQMVLELLLEKAEASGDIKAQ